MSGGNAAAFGALEQLTGHVGALGHEKFLGELKTRLGAQARKELIDGFEHGRDPYGNTWAPLRLRRGQPLRDRGLLQNSYSPQPSADGFQLGTSVRYARTHQYGAVVRPVAGKVLRFRVPGIGFRSLREAVVPARQMVPEMGTGGVGAIWGDALNREANKTMREQMGL
jgi:phage gpG-like protein